MKEKSTFLQFMDWAPPYNKNLQMGLYIAVSFSFIIIIISLLVTNRHSDSREKVVNIIDHVYRKLYGSSASDSTSKAEKVRASSKGFARFHHQDEVNTSGNFSTCCSCGSLTESSTMIQCADRSCRGRQCVYCVFGHKMEGMQPEVSTQIYCVSCRIKLSDPFCAAIAHPLLPTKLLSSEILDSERIYPLQTFTQSFVLSHSDCELLKRTDHDLQVWCLLLSDKVPFRIHWPSEATLSVNGISVHVTYRHGQQLGVNGRDDGPVISPYIRTGTNRISLVYHDERIFCLGVRIIFQLTIEEVIHTIPRDSKGESYGEALARVCQCISGGGLGDDSDMEIISDSVIINLRCPISGSRINIAGRFKSCMHIGCFDLHAYVELNRQTRKWQCPICMANYSINDLIIDPYINEITTAMKSYHGDVTEVEIRCNGPWCPRLEAKAEVYEPLEFPNLSLSLAMGSKKTEDDAYVVNGAKDYGLLRSRVIFQNNDVISIVDEDHNVNQELNQCLDHSRRDNLKVNSRSITANDSWGVNDSVSDKSQHENSSGVIVLTDTEENKLMIGSSCASGFVESDNAGLSGSQYESLFVSQETSGDFNGLAKGSCSNRIGIKAETEEHSGINIVGSNITNDPSFQQPTSNCPIIHTEMLRSLEDILLQPMRDSRISFNDTSFSFHDNKYHTSQVQTNFVLSDDGVPIAIQVHRSALHPCPVSEVTGTMEEIQPQGNRISRIGHSYKRKLTSQGSLLPTDYSGHNLPYSRSSSSHAVSICLLSPQQDVSTMYEPSAAAFEATQDNRVSLNVEDGNISSNKPEPPHGMTHLIQERGYADSLAYGTTSIQDK